MPGLTFLAMRFVTMYPPPEIEGEDGSLLPMRSFERKAMMMNGRSWNVDTPRSIIRSGADQEDRMKFAIIAVSAAAMIASAPAVFAQGVSSKTPGHEMQDRGSKKGSPGASGYAPGHEMQAKGSKKGSPGASGYAPGQTSGSNTKSKH